MFKCGLCNKQSKPTEKAFRVIVESRVVTYPAIPNAHHYWEFETGREVWKDDPGGEGLQVVREVLAHKVCIAKYEQIKREQGIDTSDIPQVGDWSNAVRGKFYRKGTT